MWYEEAVFYQFYTLGVCGAPEENGWDSNTWNGATPSYNRIGRLKNWIEHLCRLGITAVYFTPVFQSDKHGYDTRDYYTIDSRLGTNEEFAELCSSLHEKNIRVVLDGVFNHVGRGFWAFKDVQKNRKASAYGDWFFIDWNKNSDRNDGFWYEGWEGCYDLVRLNLENPAVVEHIFGAIEKWISLFRIDGIRLDVAYCLSENFLKKLVAFCSPLFKKITEVTDDFVLIGEVLFGDYNTFVNPQMLSSCTNYELYKGFYSSFNDKNLFEISYSLNRQFGKDIGLYKDKKLFNFTDNHDVSRIASILKTKNDLTLLYALMFASPGTPCLYYGSEWCLEGKKEDGDRALRPNLEDPSWNDLTHWISQLVYLYKTQEPLHKGSYELLCVKNEQLMFRRMHLGEEVIFCLNIATSEHVFMEKKDGYGSFLGLFGSYMDLYNGSINDYNGCLKINSHTVMLLKKNYCK